MSAPTNAVEGVNRFPDTSGEAEQRVGEPAIAMKFAGYVCGSVPAYGIRDISDRSLDYGTWLGVKVLVRLPMAGSFYVEAGPHREDRVFHSGS